LHYACVIGNFEAVVFLVEKCKVDTELKNIDMQTALDLCLKNSSEIEYLK